MTAEEARSKTFNQEEYDKVTAEIMFSTKKGKYNCEVDKLSEATVKKLEEDGYKVWPTLVPVSEWRSTCGHKICW